MVEEEDDEEEDEKEEDVEEEDNEEEEEDDEELKGEEVTAKGTGGGEAEGEVRGSQGMPQSISVGATRTCASSSVACNSSLTGKLIFQSVRPTKEKPA